MAAKDAVEFLIKDHGEDENSGFYDDFFKDEPYKSLLQRNGLTLDEALEKFKWQDDDAKWTSEYDKPKPEIVKLRRYRRCVEFCVGGWRELKEDFGRGDVSCLCDLATPFDTSRSPMKAAKAEFEENG